MLSQNMALSPPDLKERISFILGDAHNPDLLEGARNQSFDCIAIRQVVGLFRDPFAVFRNWHRWLKSGGLILFLDALWTRQNWSGSWSKLIDQFPLACVQSLATVPYCLQHAGFTIEKAHLLGRVNNCLANLSTDFDSPRYIVVARKP